MISKRVVQNEHAFDDIVYSDKESIIYKIISERRDAVVRVSSSTLMGNLPPVNTDISNTVLQRLNILEKVLLCYF